MTNLLREHCRVERNDLLKPETVKAFLMRQDLVEGSTLDIILEMAKELKVTDEAKKAFMRREVAGKVRRACCKNILDGLLYRERLGAKFKGLGENRRKAGF